VSDLLSIKNLDIELTTKSSTKKLVDNVSFNVGKKQSYGIVGESGCGKSITALSIMQLLSYPLRTSNGKILFQSETENIDLLKLKNNEIRKLRGKEISMIFQEPMTALDPIFTIEQQIIETLKFHTDLNKAQMRDIMIAIALICKPKLLIADEPTTALDVTIQAQILDLMNELKESYDTSIIMITHDLGVIAETCEKVAVFYAGQIVEETDVVSLFHNTAHPYSAGLLKAVTSLGDKSKTLYTIPGMVPAGGYVPVGCRFEERCDKAMEICRKRAPELIEIEDGHKCRCWLYGESGENNE